MIAWAFTCSRLVSSIPWQVLTAGVVCDETWLRMLAGGLDGHGGNGQHPLAHLTPEQRAELQQKKEYVAKQQRWLLFLRHCAKCTVPEGQCQYSGSCTVAKQLWRHILNCADPECSYPR